MKLFGVKLQDYFNRNLDKDCLTEFVSPISHPPKPDLKPILTTIPKSSPVFKRKTVLVTENATGAGFRRVSKQGAGFVPTKRLEVLPKRQTLPKFQPKFPTEPLTAINSRWESMMASTLHEPKKSKRCISFNETVICHPISRITDIIEAYDMFENETELEFEDKDVPDDILKEISLLDLAICDINANCGESPSLPRTVSKGNLISDDDSVTSLGPGCPTPERQLTPPNDLLTIESKEDKHLSYHEYSNDSGDHLQELEYLLNTRYDRLEPASIINLPRSSESTLTSQDPPQSFWKSLGSKIGSKFKLFKQKSKIFPE